MHDELGNLFRDTVRCASILRITKYFLFFDCLISLIVGAPQILPYTSVNNFHSIFTEASSDVCGRKTCTHSLSTHCKSFLYRRTYPSFWNRHVKFGFSVSAPLSPTPAKAETRGYPTWSVWNERWQRHSWCCSSIDLDDGPCFYSSQRIRPGIL